MSEPTEHDAIHAWFGLSYSNYLVAPRTLLQSMPDEWQTRFVACLEEVSAAFVHVPQADCYKVEAAREVEVGDLSDDELKQISYSRSAERCSEECEGGYLHETFYNERGDEIERWARALWPVPDPVPHYDRGRTRIEPLALPEED